MNSSRSLLAAVLSLAVLFSAGLAPLRGEDAQSDDIPGIKIGQKAPSFKLKDQDGKEHALDDLLKKGKIAVIFYRSADW